MSKYIRQFGAPLALSLALVAGACAGGDDADDTLAQDSALNRDLQLATAGDSAAQPQLEDVPAAETPAPAAPAPATPSRPRPSTSTPRPRPSTPAPEPKAPAPTTTPSGNTVTPGTAGSERPVGSIPAGTSIALRSQSKVCTNTNKVGDRFTATVAEAITGANGAAIPAGATVVIEVTSLKKSENARDNVQMGFAVRSISWEGRTYAVNADVTSATVDRVRANDTKSDAKKVIGGAVIGAVLGQVIGKDAKGTVIGAAAGAAAGTAAAAATGDVNGCVNDNAPITIRLNEATTVQAS